ncbi:MAG: protein-disulfide reductase DsbD [Betaproteobacteria bacterium]|nr:protein-disulfide reductase DsbD [Betaproteobacteria bacterium]MDE2124666.1 protein-disulfide reductase DsbD [Betaproteobacteria bacterium]MDE2187398.1 protein-disulfide reductase DsbD [Betaproteobacteria bacterium]MDE2323521.1 protein-disulfide reductase DsbD [Betaproteobacteria bacterium]
MPQVSSALRLQRLQACAPRRHDAQGLRRCVALLLLVAGLLLGLLPLAQAQQGKFLPPDEAFHAIAAVQGPKTLLLTFDIAKGYYLYQERFHFEAQTPGVTLGKPDYPPAHKKFDVNLGHEVYHYRNQVIVPLPVLAAPASFKLQLTYQGCSDEGLCYPPIDKIATVSLKGFGGTGTVSIADADEGGGAATGAATNAATGSSVTGLLGSLLGGKSGAASGAAAAAASAPAATASASVAASAFASPTSLPGPATAGAGAAAAAGGESSRIGSALASGSLLSIIPMFVLFGLLLAFTPCVLPMIPILSSIIVGQGERVSRGRGLALAVVYSLGMALVYTAFGVAAGLLGQGLAASLQNPWVLSVFALLLVVLSLSMFGFYELQLPSSLQSKLSNTSGKLQGGHFIGVFVMGGLSALIVGPCVAAPLAGALLYISQTGNAFIGGVALFALAAGMSVPLLIVGFGAGTLLPKAGGWMDGVKYFFGVLLIATALYMITPVLPDWLLMLAWAALLLVSATFLRVFDRLPDNASGWTRLFKGLGLVLALAGAALVVGLAAGKRDILQPLAGVAGGGVAGSAGAASVPAAQFQRVKTLAALDQAVASSTKPVMLDFYAAWCVSCKEMEHFTFTDPAVARQMAGMTLLQADVTSNNADDKALLKRFQLFGPPGIIFFKDGKEVGRVVGFEDAKTFLASMRRAGV